MRESIITEMKLETEAKRNNKTYQSSKDLDRKLAKTIVLECLKKERRLQKDVQKNEKTCKYYPTFCSIIGHSTTADKRCQMHGKSTAEKNSAIESMENILIEKYLLEKAQSK